MTDDVQPTSRPTQAAHYADVRHITIQEAVSGNARFPTYKAARNRLETIRDKYAVWRWTDVLDDEDSLLLWIQGFNVTPEEKAQGYIGNYAWMGVVSLSGGKFTLRVEKIPLRVRNHPKRNMAVQGKHPHPNWSHPVLSTVKKGKVFRTDAEATKLFDRLQEEYPETTIRPERSKLFLMVFSRTYKPQPLKKIVLSVLPHAGGYRIEEGEIAVPVKERARRQKVDEVPVSSQLFAAEILRFSPTAKDSPPAV
jgi:hypothetical protein